MPQNNNRTLFIVGAGASAEVGLPIGRKLTEDIASLLNLKVRDDDEHGSGDALIWEALRRHNAGNRSRLGAHHEAAQQISGAMPLAPSIDNYIDNHVGNESIAFCGKLAIVRAILAAERRSELRHERFEPANEFNLSRIANTWYSALFRTLFNRCTERALAERLRSVAFVVFNYDRCIEQFLFYALQKYFIVNEQRATEILKELRIYRPYGSVGRLPWQDANSVVPFGYEPNATNLLEYAKGIKTFTEQLDPAGTVLIREIRSEIVQATKIVFLGFAFHEDNMKLLQPDNELVAKPSPPRTKFYATTLGVSESDSAIVRQQLLALRVHDLAYRDADYQLKKLTCAEFFDEYKRSLAVT